MDNYTCDHDNHKCSAGYEPEDTRCPVHTSWHVVMKRLYEEWEERHAIKSMG